MCEGWPWCSGTMRGNGSSRVPGEFEGPPRSQLGQRWTGCHPVDDSSIVTALSLSRKKTDVLPCESRQMASKVHYLKVNLSSVRCYCISSPWLGIRVAIGLMLMAFLLISKKPSNDCLPMRREGLSTASQPL